MMNFRKTAERIIDLIADIRISDGDMDDVGYYVAHLGTPQVWRRAQYLGEALLHHSATMAQNTKEQREGEQLWLPFDQQ